MLILPLSSGDASLLTVGGKGANLAELTRSGFQVPPGFLVTTDAYRRFVSANQITTRLLPLVQSVKLDDPVALDDVSAEIRALFVQGSIPPEVEQSICDAYHELSAA